MVYRFNGDDFNENKKNIYSVNNVNDRFCI